MTDDRQRWPEPPDPELQALFDVARDPPAAPAGSRDRVLARVAATIGAAPTPTGDPLSAGAPATSGGAASAGASTGAAGATGTAGAASVTVATGGSAWAVALGGLLAVGLAGGIWLGLSGSDEPPPAAQTEAPVDPAPQSAEAAPRAAAPTAAPTATARGSASSAAPVDGADPGERQRALQSDEQPPRPTAVSGAHAGRRAEPRAERRPVRRRPDTRATRERPPAPAPAPAAAARHPAVVPAPSPAPDPRPARPHAAEEPTPDTALAAERRLLLDALRGLEAGDLPAARSALDTHRHRFPAGRLADERALLHIRWLLAADRPVEARRAADAFRARAPGSLLRPAVDALVAP